MKHNFSFHDFWSVIVVRPDGQVANFYVQAETEVSAKEAVAPFGVPTQAIYMGHVVKRVSEGSENGW